jgi:murein DD-endopeptidase MepM/ murein hydrolase activator NlpD
VLLLRLPQRKGWGRRGAYVDAKQEVDVERRFAPYLQAFLRVWREQTGSAAAALSTTDGRWAVVSTMVTAVIAGSIAWLAADTVPSSGNRALDADRGRSLMPYDLFMRLASQSGPQHASFAAFGPSASIVTNPAADSTEPEIPLDNALAAEQADQDGSDNNTRTITRESGDTLVGAMTNAGVSATDANAAVTALVKVFSPRGIKTGQSFDLTFEPAKQSHVAEITYTPPQDSASSDEDSDSDSQSGETEPAGKLLSMNFSPAVDRDISISRGADGAFGAQDVQKKLASKIHRAGATIDSSLYLAAMQAGIPADVVVEMIHMFSYEVDFQRDIHPGDKFEVLYNYYYTPEGVAAKEGNIAYATMKLADRTVSLYRYQPPNGDPPDYFDSKGQSAKSMLMKTPVDGARISSGFGMRFHPVLGYSRMHKGIDFAVPVGTPVMAAGSGTIKSEGRAGGYGNFMLINHGNGYATAYGHLSRFAPGVHLGSRVRQGQVVAYSGNTGMSTGPHLHYEIRINDQQVNPLKVKVASGRRLAGKDLRDFLVGRLHVDAQLAAMPLESRMADTGSDLRAAKD